VKPPVELHEALAAADERPSVLLPEFSSRAEVDATAAKLRADTYLSELSSGRRSAPVIAPFQILKWQHREGLAALMERLVWNKRTNRHPTLHVLVLSVLTA